MTEASKNIMKCNFIEKVPAAKDFFGSKFMYESVKNRNIYEFSFDIGGSERRYWVSRSYFKGLRDGVFDLAPVQLVNALHLIFTSNSELFPFFIHERERAEFEKRFSRFSTKLVTNADLNVKIEHAAKSEAILKTIYHKSEKEGAFTIPVNLDFADIAKNKIYPIDGRELAAIVKDLVLKGCIDILNMNAPIDTSDEMFLRGDFNQFIGNNRFYLLTVEGLNAVNQLKAKESKVVFVAMSFDKEWVEGELYYNSVKDAIEGATDLDLVVVRVDKKVHTNFIVNEIISDISESRLVIADLTHRNSGVFYEAGLAMGFGKKVIATCQEDKHDDVHFDLKQFNTMMWHKDKISEFKTSLVKYVKASLILN